MPRVKVAFGPLVACGLAAAGCLLAPHASVAQINPFRNYRGPTLSRADLDAGRDAAARLLDAPAPHVGMAETWSAPTSGNTGTLTIERIYRQKGNDCRAVRSTVHFKEGRERSFLLQTCKVNGRWRLTS